MSLIFTSTLNTSDAWPASFSFLSCPWKPKSGRRGPKYPQDVHHSRIYGLGEDELLPKSERARLQEAMREVWALPIRDKVFVLDDESLRDPAQRAGAPSAVREAGGIAHREVSRACDYYVTDRPDITEAAQRAGAKQIINHLALSLMISGPH